MKKEEDWRGKRTEKRTVKRRTYRSLTVAGMETVRNTEKNAGKFTED